MPKSPPRIAPGSPGRPSRAGKRSAEVEADDSERMERGNEIGSCEHPGPIVKEEEFMNGGMECRDMGSGVVSRTFPKMDKLVVTTRG